MIKVDDILLYITGFASDDLEAKIQHWMAEDPSNLQEFEMYAKIWNQSGSLQQFRTLDATSAWNKIEHLIKEDSIAPTTDPAQGSSPNIQESDRESTGRTASEDTGNSAKRRVLWRRIAVAVSFLLVASIATFLYLNRSPYIEISGQELAEKLNTSNSNDLVIELSDGSKIMLDDPKTTVIYPREIKASFTERKIVLKNGTATFDIVTDPNRPFIVESYPAAITVLGTIFSTFSDSVISTVENKEGLVRFSDIVDYENGVEVKEGESFSYNGEDFKDETIREEPPPPPPPRGTLERIEDIIDELEYRYPIRLDFSAYMKYNRNGIVRIDYSQPLDSIIMQLDTTAILEYSKQGRNFSIWKLQEKQQ